VFSADNFKNFLVMSDTEAFCEHTVFKIRGFSKSQHFIRVGSVNMSKMSKPGTIGLGPRIHNLRSLQTNFINSIASKSTIFDGGGASQDQSSHTAAAMNAEDKCGVPDPPTATDLSLLRMKTNLLPLLLKQDLLDLDAFWSPAGDSSKIASVILDIAKDLPIGCKEEYSDAWKEAVRLNGHIIVPRLGATATFAVQSECNMSQMQMKSLRRCLRAETGSSIFSTEMKTTQTLGLEYVEPATGVYNKIPRSYKYTVKVIRLCLVTLFKSSEFRCNHIDITISIHHGKGHSRANLNVIPHWQLEDGSWGEESHVFTLGKPGAKKITPT
jgi:hypothetical protein